MITNTEIQEAISPANPRNGYHLMLSMILFTPEDSDIRRELESVLSSLAFSPPENESLHLGRFPEIVSSNFGDEESKWPEFVKIMVSIFSLQPCYKPDQP